jgi:arylsulfatase A-like enzyme
MVCPAPRLPSTSQVYPRSIVQKIVGYLVLMLALLAPAAGRADAADPSGRRVVVVVWDGMRPDFIDPETTPHLWALTRTGVFFANHHPAYLSATEVNGTAIATGAYPAHSFVIANTDYRPRINPERSVGVEIPEVVHKGDEVSGHQYLGRPTLAEILHRHGLATAIAGSKYVALLQDRDPRSAGAGASPVLDQGEIMPPGLGSTLVGALGAIPPAAPPDDKRGRDTWTTRALLDVLWRNAVPPFTLLWLAEPDSTQHATGVGSPQSLAAIKSSDDHLGLVLAELDGRGLRAGTDVLVVSDHGFSTISRKVDVAAELARAGLDANRSFPRGVSPGQIMTVANGGSTLLYVGGHDAGVCARLTDFLLHQDWTGVVFSRLPAEGTFPLGRAHLDTPEAPDFVVSLRWTEDKNAAGAPGLAASDLKASSAKLANHASLCRFDMHNTLVAAGPDFRVGVRDPLPTGNYDLAPTILWILGLRDEVAAMDGRVLGEALTVAAPPLRTFDLRHLTARRDLGDGRSWEQYLNVSEVNGVEYLDDGNGAQQSAP